MRRMKRAIAVIGVLALSACGGGGGDSGSAAPTEPAQREQPLQIDERNRIPSLQIGLLYAEALLALAHDIGVWMQVDLPASQGTSVTCGVEGSRQVRLEDRDGDGRLSVGDRVSLQLARCRAAASDNVFTGGVVVAVQTLPASGGWAGRIEFADPGLTFQSGGFSFSWRGAVGASVFVGNASPMLRRIALNSAAGTPLELLVQANGTSARDVFTDLRLQHEATLEQAGTRTSIDLRLASDVLRGSIRVQTPEALAAYFDTFAHEGLIRIQGANGDTLDLRAADGRQAGWLTAWVDGTQQPDTPTGLLWRQLSPGYLWWGSGTAPQAYGETRELQERSFSATVVSGEAFDAGSLDMLLLFSSVPAPGTRPVAWLKHESLDGAEAYFGPSRIDTAATLNGAALSLRLAQPLVPGQLYTLHVVDQLPSGDFAAIRDGRSGALFGLASTWRVKTALTAPAVALPLTDRAVLPGRPITLEAQPSGQARAYQWRQVEGPPLLLSTDSGIRTTVSLPDGAAGDVADAVLELAVVSNTGAVDRTRRTIKVVPSPARATLLRVQAGPGAGPGRDLFTQASAFGYSSTDSNSLRINLTLPLQQSPTSVQFLFFAAPGQPLVPGSYTIVPGRFGVPRSGPDVIAGWDADICSSGMSGSFTVHEIAVATEREFDGFPLQNAAIDFDISCESGAPVSGSIRFFSSVPLR